CKGKGYTKSASSICYEILRQVRREAKHMTGDTIQVHAAPAVAEVMNGPETAAVDNMVKRVQKGIEVHARRDFHIEHYEIRSRNKMRD
ncbi:MAG: Rne/Rng family ribonuclease, partial [Myxococcales bacterium]|nr:Rne/Rng family ribonuclease [Myxococcales bacterium]